MHTLAQWLASTSLSQTIQKALWVIPLLQAIHILALAALLAAVAMIVLRILRAAGRSQTMGETIARFLPWLWGGLAVLAATGIVLIIGEPRRALINPAFQLKMLLLACALVLTLAFQLSLRGNATSWESGSRSRAALAVCAFILWCAIAFAGRWIAYLA
jgi:hypothetical protein